MRVAILGAGIGGLAAAIALSRNGIDVDVYEQIADLRAAGVGISISANGTAALYDLGLKSDLDTFGAVVGGVEFRRWENSKLLHREQWSADGLPHLGVHRADLQQALRRQVPGERVHLNRRLIGFEQDATGVTLRFADGGSARADLLIASDGIRSTVRDLLGDETKLAQPIYSGAATFRGLTPIDRVPSLDKANIGGIAWMGNHQAFVFFPISGGKYLNFLAHHKMAEPVRESWAEEGDLSVARAMYQTWTPAVREILAGTDRIMHWGLYDRVPLKTWIYGRVVLMGDAAHAILPFLGQGATMALEDALVLAACLKTASATDYAAALQEYETRRLPRTTDVYERTRKQADFQMLPDGEAQQARDAALAEKGWGMAHAIVASAIDKDGRLVVR